MHVPDTVEEMLRMAAGLTTSDHQTVTFYVRYGGRPATIAIGIGPAAQILHDRMQAAVSSGEASRELDPRIPDLPADPWERIAFDDETRADDQTREGWRG